VVQVAINTTITDVSEFLDHIVASTNMRCATPRSALEGECGFLAANLYAKSVFGEDALVNVSVEKQPDGKLAGYIRIRCVACSTLACIVHRFEGESHCCCIVRQIMRFTDAGVLKALLPGAAG